MLIKSKDDVVSFSFGPEDAVSLTRFPDLATRVQPALLELIQDAQQDSAAISAGFPPRADSAAAAAMPDNGTAAILTAGHNGQD